jgi:ubiquinone/menaquinone biosynthesis C-methylase UbiE
LADEREFFSQHAREYDALVAREDYQGNILRGIQQIVKLEGLVVLDLGSGTGRIAALLAPLVRRVLALDRSTAMLNVAFDNLVRSGRDNWLIAAADNCNLPLPAGCADLVISGWSISYLSVWHPDRWRAECEAWLLEASRVLRRRGLIILLESLGTGNQVPQHLVHLENFYDWLGEKGFAEKWIRTDYRFETQAIASEAAGSFFGNEMRERIIREKITILPECTGIWWLNP